MKHIIQIAVIVTVALTIWLGMWFLEADQVLSVYNLIFPPAEIKMEDWVAAFKTWGSVALAVSLIAALIWYVLAQWVFKISSWTDTRKRGVWGILVLLPVAGSVAACFLIERTQQGAVYAYLFLALNGLLCYYIATLLTSPSAFKYTPLGARTLRFW